VTRGKSRCRTESKESCMFESVAGVLWGYLASYSGFENSEIMSLENSEYLSALCYARCCSTPECFNGCIHGLCARSHRSRGMMHASCTVYYTRISA
jgi:hypothetical protein